MICNIATHYCAIALRNIYLYLLIDLCKISHSGKLSDKINKSCTFGKIKVKIKRIFPFWKIRIYVMAIFACRAELSTIWA